MRFSFITILLAACFLSGCSLKFGVERGPVSHITYQNVDQKPLVMRVVDQREDKVFAPPLNGKIDLVLNNVENPMGWLGRGLEREFEARNVPLKVESGTAGADADITLTVNKYQIVNYRASGFSAWESYHFFLGQVSMGDKSCSIPAYFFNSDVPVWTIDEVVKPCISMPMTVVVKDIAAKINRCLFGYGVSDDNLRQMEAAAVKELVPESEYGCYPSMDLGSSNNPLAMKQLQAFAGHEDSLVHNCAASAIGLLGKQDQFDYLVSLYNKFTNNDKAMPLKAIGDIGGEKAIRFLKDIRSSDIYSDENSVKYCVDLYLTGK